MTTASTDSSRSSITQLFNHCYTSLRQTLTSRNDYMVIIRELFQAGVIAYIAYEGTEECLDVHNVANWNLNRVILLSIATAGGAYKCFRIQIPGNYKQKSLGLMLSTAGFVKGLLFRTVLAECSSLAYRKPEETSEENLGVCSKSCLTNFVLPISFAVFASYCAATGIKKEIDDVKDEDIQDV